MLLKTKRLHIIPLSTSQMNLFIESTEKLEADLKLLPSVEVLNDVTTEALKYNLNLITSDPANHMWYAFWAIIDIEANKMVANACFKNKPDGDGRVEIGYGTYEPSRNKGYMSEAVLVMTDWVLSQDQVKTVIAETNTENVASQRVLEKCGFKKYSQSEGSFYWERKNYTMRAEAKADYSEIYTLIKEAFATAEVKDGDEQDYAEKLRISPKYIPALALVAEYDGELIGHIMFTKLTLSLSAESREVKALLVAPLSVKLEYRNLGVGSALMKEGFRIAAELGYTAVFLCGYPEYYKRFGFVPSANYGITNVNAIPDMYSLARELTVDALKDVSGTLDFY